MPACAECRRRVEAVYRFCPWCGSAQRTKLVEFFLSHLPGEERRALRVSRYLREGHVRFSVWDEDEAQAAISIDEREAARLSAYLAGPRRPSRVRQLLRSLEFYGSSNR